MGISACAYWRLTRWLGPWTDGTRAPRGVARQRLVLEAHGSEEFTVEVLVYVPTDRPAIGSYLIAHGLNPHGPDDERCDRFARVLSHAGFIVMCPRLSALTQMRLDATAIAELSLSLEALVALDGHPRHQLPGIFSVSFGSFPALMTATSPRVGHLVGSLIVFGGYANFLDTCRFMMGTTCTGSSVPQPDPTCMAGLAINTAGVLFGDEEARQLTDAWRAFVSRVWGAPEMREPKRFAEVARELGGNLPAGLTQIFLQGCGVAPGFAQRVEEALQRTDTDAMDPRAQLHAVRCPVHLFQARHDDVIPYTQMQVLATALARAKPKTYLTGLYDHGGSAATALARLPTLLQEMKTMAAMVHAMVISGTRPV